MPANFITSSSISGYKQSFNFEPYRSYNWGLFVDVGSSKGPGPDPQGYLALAVETGQNPNVSAEEITLGFGNDRIYIAGQEVVEPIAIQFRDFMEPAIAAIMRDWWKQRYDSITGASGFASQYKKQGMLYQYAQNGDGRHDRSWSLEGIWPQAINFGGSLDHNTSEIVRVEVTFRYDRAIPGGAAGGSSAPPSGPNTGHSGGLGPDTRGPGPAGPPP